MVIDDTYGRNYVEEAITEQKTRPLTCCRFSVGGIFNSSDYQKFQKMYIV